MADNKGLRINPEIHVGEILNLLAMLGTVSVFMFYSGSKIENHEVRIQKVEERTSEDRNHIDQRFQRIEDLIREMGDSVSRKADR